MCAIGVTSYSLGASHRYRSWTVMGERRSPQARVRLMWPQPARGIVKFNRFHTISTLSLFETKTGVDGEEFAVFVYRSKYPKSTIKVLKMRETVENKNNVEGGHNFAVGPCLVFSPNSLALSRINLRKSFPLGFFGMLSTNSTPPARCLYATLASETCWRVDGQRQVTLHVIQNLPCILPS